MTTLIVSIPKCGQHATQKACLLLGVSVGATHCRWPINGDHRYIVPVRHPRNVLVSYLRMARAATTPESMIATINEGMLGVSFAQWFGKFARYLDNDVAHVVRYECLIADDRAMRELAYGLDVPYVEGAWEKLPGGTVTWHEQHSDWRTCWTDEIDAAWRAAGGHQIEADYGY